MESKPYQREKSSWVRVTRAEPCPICERPDYCTRATDGMVVKCMRVESHKPVANGGWLHNLSEPLPTLVAPKRTKRTKKQDWTRECRQMYEHAKAADMRRRVAKKLQVSESALDRLRVGIGWDEWRHREFSSWPSRDHNGRCIGYVRRYAAGSKRTNLGGGTGVFYTHRWWQLPGPVLIVEGGSDVAACDSFDIPAIGRASNVHGGAWIGRLIRRHAPDKRIVVIGERDEKPEKRGRVASCPPDCTGCAYCWPGLYGMRKVAAELGGVGLMVPPAYKDIRDQLTRGGLAELLEALAEIYHVTRKKTK